MDAVGKLTGGVAHDFNNVLQIIGGNLQLLVRDVAGNLRAEQRLQTAIAAISRGSKLASQLLSFGRRQALAPKVTNLGRLIRSIDDMLRRALGEGVEIETIIAGGLWNTFVDMLQVENALLNLAINARDAMGGHGKLTIEAGNAFLDGDYASRHADVAAGQYVVIAVSDTGTESPQILWTRCLSRSLRQSPKVKVPAWAQHGLWFREAIWRPYQAVQRAGSRDDGSPSYREHAHLKISKPTPR
jgi:signal transduction histidine kinase